jgi:hypothetical protein
MVLYPIFQKKIAPKLLRQNGSCIKSTPGQSYGQGITGAVVEDVAEGDVEVRHAAERVVHQVVAEEGGNFGLKMQGFT